jgi:hypothetical protein
MRMMSKTLFCAAIVAAQTSVASAADEQGRYAAGYPATMSCTDLASAEIDSREIAVVAGFADGWLAAHAKFTPDTFDFTPWQTIEYVLAQLRAYCTARPDDVLMTALTQLTRFLEPDVLTRGAEAEMVSNGDQVVMLHPDVIDRIQSKLRTLGYADESAEEPMTGLRAFQKNESLPQSGLPDQRTLQALFAK